MILALKRDFAVQIVLSIHLVLHTALQMVVLLKEFVFQIARPSLVLQSLAPAIVPTTHAFPSLVLHILVEEIAPATAATLVRGKQLLAHATAAAATFAPATASTRGAAYTLDTSLH